MSCLICGSFAEIGGASLGDYVQFDCIRCGQFEITGTAKALVRTRLDGDETAAARLSHAIRSQTSRKAWFRVDSSNLDDLIASPLPRPNVQKLRFLSWIESQCHGDILEEITITEEHYPEIMGYVGLISSDTVDALLEELEGDDLIQKTPRTLSGQSLRLTSNGADALEAFELKEREENITAVGVSETSSISQEITSDCPKCGSDKRANVKAKVESAGTEGLTSWSRTIYTVECGGCGRLNVKEDYWFSEWDFIDEDPYTGKPRMNPGIRTKYLNPLQIRPRPKHFDDINDEALKGILKETYSALDQNFMFLASIGSRSAIDRLMTNCVGDKGGFARKLSLMEGGGHISSSEKEILETMIDVGNASAHRGHAPSKSTIEKVLNALEGLVYRILILPSSMSSMKIETPSR